MDFILKARIKKGEYADVLVDEDIFNTYNGISFWLKKGIPSFPNCRSLQKEILGIKGTTKVKHLNGNKLDLRRANLIPENGKTFKPENFYSKLDKEHTECWIWTGKRALNGYGSLKINGKDKTAHRMFYEYFIGAIGENQEVDHLCRNRQCVNPEHLEAVSHSVNVRRGLHVDKSVRGVVYLK